jgi:hypothetical protein
MRGIASYVMAAVLVALLLGFVIPAGWLGLPVRAWPMVERGATMQHVDRAHKADRLVVPVTVVGKTSVAPISAKEQQPAKPAKSPAKILDGCDPVFSPLSASAHANLPGRCAA